jgi:Mlc titration factor MtfA (ptsG expression regulator)
MALLIIVLLALLLVGWLLSAQWRARRRRLRLRVRPFPAQWRRIIRRRVPAFRRLPADLQQQLCGHIQVFLAEKDFIGCDSLEVTDEMRVTIAALACLLILNRDTDYYPNLRQVLVYPGAFVVDMEESDEAGVVVNERHVLSGESWSQSQVILSWQDVKEGAAVADDGYNVVIHEFAHQLDQEAGYANGAPELASRGNYARWSRVLGDEYQRLRARTEAGEASLLDDYGATDPAEFFAVLAEVFFEQPRLLQEENPALYEELSRFFRVSPAAWAPAAETSGGGPIPG